jgi:hypothetical protein
MSIIGTPMLPLSHVSVVLHTIVMDIYSTAPMVSRGKVELIPSNVVRALPRIG